MHPPQLLFVVVFTISLLFSPIIVLGQSIPPATWREHWFEHNQLLTRVFYDDDVAVYFDDDMDPSITWMNQFCGDMWRYAKNLYGDMDGGGSDSRLFAIFHQNKYSGGHPAYYYDPSHDFRNVEDIGQDGSWAEPTGWSLDATTHEVCHIVESTTNGVRGSPCFTLWHDSKWGEIFNYDVYVGLQMGNASNRWYNEVINNVDSFPRSGTQWFKNWFYPIWSQFGRGQVLSRFFKVMAQYFPKNGNSYARDMNYGEFVHFWSAAANKNLKPQATIAFGWSTNWEQMWQKARADFPFTYPD